MTGFLFGPAICRRFLFLTGYPTKRLLYTAAISWPLYFEESTSIDPEKALWNKDLRIVLIFFAAKGAPGKKKKEDHGINKDEKNAFFHFPVLFNGFDECNDDSGTGITTLN